MGHFLCFNWRECALGYLCRRDSRVVRGLSWDRAYSPRTCLVSAYCRDCNLEGGLSRARGSTRGETDVLSGNFGRSVIAAIVHYRVVPILIRLSQDALNALREVLRSIVHWSDYTNQWLRSHIDGLSGFTIALDASVMLSL